MMDELLVFTKTKAWGWGGCTAGEAKKNVFRKIHLRNVFH